MKVKTILLGASALLAVCATAHASQRNGWYIGLEAGANWIDDVDAVATLTVPATPPPFVGLQTFEFDTGWAILGAGGYAFANNWRLEAELGYRVNERTGINRNMSEWSLMLNALYDINLTPKLDLSLGAGAGYDRPTLQVTVGEDTKGAFAYQGIVGLSYALSGRTDLTLNYRYLRVSATDFIYSIGPDSLEMDLEDISKHTVTLGLRYSFGREETAAPPPPPPAPPSPPPGPRPKSFVIFFGFAKCNITPEADTVLSDAANAAKSGNAATVRIVGHTDSAGSPKANQRLSECRANAAKSNLAGKGISEGSITASGKGESELLVQTGDNVKEPQNRRATIDLN